MATREMDSGIVVLTPTQECPTVTSRLYDWAVANPLKVQAALALVAGSIPEGLRQLLVILL